MKIGVPKFCTLFALGALLSVCSGCWEEIQYQPKLSEPATGVINAVATEEVPTADQANDDPPADEEPDTAATELSSSDLFEAEPSKTETPSTSVPETPEPAVTEQAGTVENAPLDGDSEPSDTETSELQPSETALAVWRMASRWSMAAAIYAKDKGPDLYTPLLDQARTAAEQIGAKLPEFPTAQPEGLQAAVLAYLLDTGTTELANNLSDESAGSYQALAELAAKSHALLLVYTPKSTQLAPVIDDLRATAERSGLPPHLYNNLLGMLDRREPFNDVKREILAMHAGVSDYLAGRGE